MSKLYDLQEPVLVYNRLSANEAQSSWHEKLCASTEGIMLNFELYQGADALIAQVQEPGELGLGGLVIDHLSETLHSGTKLYCDWFFTSIKAVNRMMEKQVYLIGTVMKNWVSEVVQKLPSDKTMKRNGRGISAQVTTEDGENLCCKVV